MTAELLPDLAMLPVVTDLQGLLLSGVPLLDVRAPVEFAEGAMPGAVNLPLMDNADRQEIGTRYKQAGQDEAIQLGLTRVDGDIKASRVAAWEAFAGAHPDGVLYCFRGGLRSKISQQWLYTQTGIRYPRVEGGYKALRSYLLGQLESLSGRVQPVVLSGRTGCGKTRFLTTFQQQIDLEGLANHRGSAFGPLLTPQPSQAGFENALAVRLLQQLATGSVLMFEDESRSIGSVHIPDTLFALLKSAPVVLLETPDEERTQISYQEYVLDMVAAFTTVHGDEDAGFTAFRDYLLGSLAKIRKRLGGVRYARIESLMQSALAEQRRSGDTSAHLYWVRMILFEYYDPMYDYQLECKRERLVFRGGADDVRAYLTGQGIR